jgi:hypothetical protein
MRALSAAINALRALIEERRALYTFVDSGPYKSNALEQRYVEACLRSSDWTKQLVASPTPESAELKEVLASLIAHKTSLEKLDLFEISEEEILPYLNWALFNKHAGPTRKDMYDAWLADELPQPIESVSDDAAQEALENFPNLSIVDNGGSVTIITDRDSWEHIKTWVVVNHQR